MNFEAIFELMFTFYPEECDILGEERLASLIEKKLKIVETKNGSNIPIIEIIGLLSSVLTIVEFIYSIVQNNKNKLNKSEIMIALKDRTDIEIDKIDPRFLELIIQEIIDKNSSLK